MMLSSKEHLQWESMYRFLTLSCDQLFILMLIVFLKWIFQIQKLTSIVRWDFVQPFKYNGASEIHNVGDFSSEIEAK